ncbi:hypothetical protein PF005_g9592 [Phytophthora fragariae]|uniref:Uncharacterized protein n=1 Tax=Phytophthora fragariae TaxID=53985 RepID=A0A6A4DRK5_9STRA|nr:hypothetical protein PF003_g24006 [Phytophthora fragariae]KAE8939359.1 hypothetical protein PF009_g10799 [Phytophthora fragariae]KAE8996213.1 hypothetical protein PF011_g15996 [Phytophthora fragariae]KAE9095766.1 hypothetical protein PF010_g16584 [Phytophthora fragariae]KAE9116777.1 hypothetical protein PF007_g9539 [Phytophthora fragariae]
MPQTLVFVEQVPTYVYQNVNFQATVKLVNEHKAKVTGVHKPLQVSLRFHDTYDLVEDQDAVLRLAAEARIDPNTGLALLSMSLHTLTATCDRRNFCLEVRSADADIESVFSAPVNVVKEKLQVATQPPDVWFKDEGGREKCMTVALSLVPAPGAYLEDRVVPLDVRLLYESGNAMLNQSILRLFPDMRPNMMRGRVTISFRIDDVSKNHQGQSFMLEIGPEQQDGSSMFQDIAPTRTSVIAIRSKRNKRKLNAQAAAVAAATGVYGMRASPRTPYMNAGAAHNSPQGMNAGAMMVEPHPQRARKYMATSSGMGYGMMQQPPQQPMASMSWSSHLMQPSASAVAPMQPHTPQTQQPPVQTPAAGAANSPGAVEWALGGFEIHPDGSMNTARPIYRCPHCRRLNDVDMLAAGPALSHSPQCVFAPNGGNGNMMYRSRMEGTPMNQQHPMQQQQSRGYAAYQQMSEQGAAMSMGMSAQQTTSTSSYGSSAMVDSSSLNVQQNTVNITSKPEDASPKTMAALATSSTQRPSMTISPYMNKVTTEGTTPGSSGQEQGSSGNLFESNAFHNQMEMMGTSTEKLFMNKSTAVEDDPALDPQQRQQSQNYQETGPAFNGVIGTSLFNEMSNMGINLDQYDKGDSQLLGEFNGLEAGAAQAPNDEDQVFYILARMYTDAREQKLGLPAFDQFQRMLGFYSEAQDDVQTQVVFHPLRDVCLSDDERQKITSQFVDELRRDSQAVHSLPKYQHNLIMLREDALMFYWSQSLV